jgi:hypothetical protein
MGIVAFKSLDNVSQKWAIASLAMNGLIQTMNYRMGEVLILK